MTAPILEMHHGIAVVREDLFPGGTNARRVASEINPRTLRKSGGESGLRSPGRLPPKNWPGFAPPRGWFLRRR